MIYSFPPQKKIKFDVNRIKWIKSVFPFTHPCPASPKKPQRLS